MATSGVSPTMNGSFRDTQHQSTGQSSRDDGATAQNSWNDEHNQDEAPQNGLQQEPQHPAAPSQPLNNRKSNDSTNRNPIGTNENINSNGNHYNNNNNNQAQTQTQTVEADAAAHQPWFRRVAEKYGTLELDNKGSVARDHLALGTLQSPTHTHTLIGCSMAPTSNRHRTHIPRLAPDIPLIRLHRHRSNPIVPSQQLRILHSIATNLYRLSHR